MLKILGSLAAEGRSTEISIPGLLIDHPLPQGDDDEDYIDIGAAILGFYCTLVDLLGRCAPESSVIAQVVDPRSLIA